MGSDGVIVEGGNTSVPYVSQNNSNPMQGMIRVWGSDMQVFDGTAWINMSTSYATVKMDSSIVGWVREKQAEEYKHKQELEAMKRRAAEHPSLTKAYEAIIRAEEELNAGIDRAVENFKLLDKLVGEEQSVNEEGMMAP